MAVDCYIYSVKTGVLRVDMNGHLKTGELWN